MLFEKRGKRNTDQAIECALQRAGELGINHLVVASNSGATAEKVWERDKSKEIICVTHHVGYKGPGVDEMEPETRQKLQEAGVKILTTTHLLAGVDRALRFKFEGIYPPEIIANSLRMLGQGLKVCVEISSMALDAGLIPYGEEIIALGGAGRGADTAVAIVPAHSNYFFDTEIKEVICIPRDKK